MTKRKDKKLNENEEEGEVGREKKIGIMKKKKIYTHPALMQAIAIVGNLVITNILGFNMYLLQVSGGVVHQREMKKSKPEALKKNRKRQSSISIMNNFLALISLDPRVMPVKSMIHIFSNL